MHGEQTDQRRDARLSLFCILFRCVVNAPSERGMAPNFSRVSGQKRASGEDTVRILVPVRTEFREQRHGSDSFRAVNDDKK